MNSPRRLRWRAIARDWLRANLSRRTPNRRRVVRAEVDRELQYIVRYPWGRERCGTKYPSLDDLEEGYRATRAADLALIYFVDDEENSVTVVHVQRDTMDAPIRAQLVMR